MSLNITKISWTETTWNPVTGCTQISPGCNFCYAKAQTPRLKAMGNSGFRNDFRVTLNPERLDAPRKIRKPSMIFVCSMSDSHHRDIPDSYRDQIYDVIRDCPQHTFQILTKRADLMAEYFQTRPVPTNAWIGVTVENKQHGLPRIEHLKQIDAKVRFLSIEPLIEDLGYIDLTGINQVIVGGETGVQARPMNPDWVRNIRDMCDAQGVPFFFKQWSAWGPNLDKRRGKKHYSNELDGQIHEAYPATAEN